jgi:hypothetical protein
MLYALIPYVKRPVGDILSDSGFSHFRTNVGIVALFAACFFDPAWFQKFRKKFDIESKHSSGRHPFEKTIALCRTGSSLPVDAV